MKIKFHFEKLDFLIALYIFCIVAAELMGGKTFPIVDYGFLKLNASVAVFLPASKRFAPSESAYDKIFTQSIRIYIASLIAFAAGDFLDVFIFSKIRKAMGKKALWFRNNASNFLAQFIDTTLFISLAFYSFAQPVGDNITFLTSLIIPYWALKCFMSIIETPFVYLGVKWLKKN